MTYRHLFMCDFVALTLSQVKVFCGNHWMFSRQGSLMPEITKRHDPDESDPFILRFPGLPDLPIHLHSRKDIWISDFIRNGSIFEPQIIALIRSLVCAGDIVLDIGANIGYTALILAECVGKNGIVHAFEPEPENYTLLERNARQFGQNRIITHPVAAGENDGIAKLSLSPDNLGDHRIEQNAAGRNVLDIQVCRLDRYPPVRGLKINFVKIDTQGSETDVLAGLYGSLHDARIVLEYWPYGLERCGSSLSELMTILDTQSRRYWLVEHWQACTELSVEQVLEVGRERMTPQSQMHGDLVCLSAADTEGIQIMETLSSNWIDHVRRLAGSD